MDAKTLKLYEILIAYTENEFVVRKKSAYNFANALLELDFEYGLDGLHYLFLKQEKLFEYAAIRDDLTAGMLSRLLEKNRTKAVKAILASPVLLKGFFTMSAKASEGDALDILVSLLLANKLEDGETILKAIQKNTLVPFGQVMTDITNSYLDRLPRVSEGSKIPQINKKTANLLLGYIDRIKGFEKPLLVQRIKELL